MKISTEVPKKLKIELLSDPAFPFLGICPREMKPVPWRDFCTPSQCSYFWQTRYRSNQCWLKDEWIKENAVYMRMHRHTEQYYSPTERRRSFHLWKHEWTHRTLGWDRHKRQYCMISCVCRNKKKKIQTHGVLGWTVFTRVNREGRWIRTLIRQTGVET